MNRKTARREGLPPCPPSQCKTCIFRRDGKGVKLRPGRLAEITAYLIAGRTHVCHTESRGGAACRGGRDIQLTVWHRIGHLAEPTDKALADAMAKYGL